MADMYLGNESGGFDLVGTTNIKNIDFEEAKISKEDYENLSEEERKTGIHLVTGLDDTENGGGSADLISYDNTNSGLGSTNVQGAIDELNSNLSPENLTVSKVTDSTVTAYECKKSGNVVTCSFNCAIAKALEVGSTWYQFAKLTSALPSSTIYFPVVYGYVNPTVGRINTSGVISFLTKSVSYTKNMPIYGSFSYIVD